MKRLFLLLSIAATVHSCVPTKKLYFFNDLNPGLQLIDSAKQSNVQKIKIGDQLVINVSVLDPAQTTFINGGGQSSSNAQRRYIVRSDSTIDFPTLGRVLVVGLTVRQTADSLTQKLRFYYNEPYVYVSLAGRVFFLSGRNGGVIEILGERLTILEAISQLGTQNPLDERDKVWLIREMNNERQYVQVNLNSKEIFNSPYYYLQSNDVLYLRPSKYSSAFSPNSTFGFGLALLATVSTLIILFNTLIK